MIKTATNTSKVYVIGMHCQACAELLKEDLEEVEGIKNVTVDLKHAFAMVEHEGVEPPLEAMQDNTKYQLSLTPVEN